MRSRFPLVRLTLAHDGGLARLALPPTLLIWPPTWPAWLARFRPWLARPRTWLASPPAWLAAERDRLVLWLPVLMGAGVVTYFALRQEPPIWAGLALLLPALIGATLARPASVLRALLAMLAAFALGLAAAQFATWRAPPLVVLPTNAVTITGIVRGVDPLPDGRRLLLEAVRIDPTTPPLERPTLDRLIRVRLRTGDPIEVATGDTVRLRALL